MARARTLQKQDYSVIALMGDGAITGGLAYEGLNDAGESNEPLIVILNDNGMSITPNVGGVASHLSNIRMRPEYYRLKRAWRDATKTNAVGRGLYKISHSAKESLGWARKGKCAGVRGGTPCLSTLVGTHTYPHWVSPNLEAQLVSSLWRQLNSGLWVRGWRPPRAQHSLALQGTCVHTHTCGHTCPFTCMHTHTPLPTVP